MTNPQNVRELLVAALRERGYDGLYQAGGMGCACELADLAPCENPDPINCHPGYRGPCPAPGVVDCGGDCDFHMVKDRPAAMAEQDEPMPDPSSAKATEDEQ